MKLKQETACAINAIKAAAKESLKYFGKTNKTFYKKGDELVTQIDIDCENIIKNLLINDFPNYGFLGEESEEKKEDTDYKWIVDPIDGTVNFSRGINLYGISIALANKNKVILGIVYNPVSDELFVAEKSQGTTLNGVKTKVSNEESLDRSVIYSTELFKSDQHVSSLYKKIKQFRITSSSAYETCLVAAGRIEGFIKVTTNPWGFAAANLIVEEAGGEVTNFKGEEWDTNSTHIVSSNGFVHKKLLESLN
ncbi:inositol monophosphatase family protein [Patescibacteria group bacterium]